MNPRARDARTRGGLTILEIIVILLVLVILAAVVFPILGRTCHGHARKDDCQWHLKECAIALQLYWNDYDGHLPSSAIVRGSRKWNERDFRVFAARAGGGASRLRGWAQLAYPYMRSAQYRDEYAYCPSDRAAQQSSGSQTSYWWKLAVDKAWYGVGCKKPCRKESDFAFGADQIVLYEKAGLHHRCPQGLKNGVYINAAYLDTHVKSVGLTNSLSSSNRNWITTPTALGEPAYFNFDNSRYRGAGNPPAPDVRTRYIDPSRYSDMLL